MDAEPRKRILVVDDAEINQVVIATLLEKWGFATMVVADGRAAVDAALGAMRDGQPFKLILMDMQMPVMDGFAATSALRAAGYESMIVAITAETEEAELERCLQAGCDGCLAKPIEPRSFRAAVEAYAARG